MSDQQTFWVALLIVAGLPGALLAFIRYVKASDARELQRAIREHAADELLDAADNLDLTHHARFVEQCRCRLCRAVARVKELKCQ